MKNYKYIIFDFDYTLADSSEAIIGCMNYALEKCGYPRPNPDQVRNIIGITLPESFTILTGESSVEQITKFRSHFRDMSLKIGVPQTYIFDYVPEVLHKLNNSGNRLAIVSTRNRSRIEPVLSRDKLDQYFEAVIGGEDVKAHKPDPEGLHKAINTIKADISETVYIGDSVTDAKTANSAGVDFMACLSGVTSADKFVGFEVVQIIDDLQELPALLLNSKQS